MPEYDGYEEEMFDDEVTSSYREESDDDDVNPTEEAFLKGYEDADNIDSDWDFDEDSDEEE